jgi:hypothetical protein
MQPRTIIEYRKALHRKGYAFFESGQYNLNIIGVRSTNSESNEFDDLIAVIYRDKDDRWQIHQYPATTDPGKPWLLFPMHRDGTAIVVPDQYRGVYQVGIHGRSHAGGGYKALEQVKVMRYVRDNNRDSVVDATLYSDPRNIFTANLRTNLHRASKWAIVRWVEKFSAGCQVIQNPAHFDQLVALCERAARTYGNRFTYTLLEEKDFE